MRKVLIFLTCMLSLVLVACGVNDTSKKAVEDGKVAIVSKEYEKARDLFQLAVNEDSKNTEAKDLLNLANDYIELLNVLDSQQYESLDELILRIDENKCLDIIRTSYEETKEVILQNRESALKFGDEVSAIEEMLEEGNIDEAKSLAMNKLDEVVGNKKLEERLNLVISGVDEIINNAKAEILNFHSGEDIVYKGLKDSSHNGYSVVDSLKEKVLLCFKEDQQFGSPKEYMYDIDTKNIYRADQGRILLVNNNNEVLYELVDSSNEQANIPNISGTVAQEYLTKDEAIEIASGKLKEDFQGEEDLNAVGKEMYAGCYEVDMFDVGGRLYYGTYVVDAKSGSCWRK